MTSWFFEDVEHYLEIEEEIQWERVEAIDLLQKTGLFSEIEITTCMIPQQIFTVLNTGEYCYTRDNRYRENPEMTVFAKKHDLVIKWETPVAKFNFYGKVVKYQELASAHIAMVNQYIAGKK